MKKLYSVIVVALFVFVATAAFAESPASNKFFFAKGGGVTIAPLNNTLCEGFDGPITGALCSDWVPIITANDALKTSNVGAIEAAVSAECALWTYNTVTAVSGGGKQTSSSRAGVQVRVLIDGDPAEPGAVVFCDRAQATGLQVDTVCSCTVPLTTCVCTVTDTITLELFQRTKNANSFHFFNGPLGATIHDVVVEARGIVACYSNGASVPCPNSTLDAYTDAKTAAAIGKATLAVEEHNNWGTNY